MKLYDEYKKVIKKLGKIEKAYFTSFNIDISFVEKYILPPLLKESVANDKFSLEDLNIALMSKAKPDIKLFYDASMMSSFDKKTLVETYPILIKGGVFHPKVIYLKGSERTYLFVGSGNLSVSGWGRNIEAFEIVDITKFSSLENQVLNFFDDVFELAGLQYKNKKRKINVTNRNFVFTLPKNSNDNSLLLNALEVKENLQIFSPYFSDDLDSLVSTNEFKNIKNIAIIPDLVGDKNIRLKKLPEDKRISFYRFKDKQPYEENEESINHSKIWISDAKYAIGSHNCTIPALYGKNFEASLVQNLINKDEFSLDNFIANEPEISQKILLEDEVHESERFNSLYQLTADYEDNSLELEEIVTQAENIFIKLPSFKDRLLTQGEFKELKKDKISSLFRALTKNKIFEIYEEEKLIFRGLIIEKNATSKTRFVESAETLDDIFLAFADEKNPTEAKHLQNRDRFEDIGDEIQYKRKYKATNVNYYSMYRGFNNLFLRYEKIKNDELKLESFCFSSPSSLSVVKNILENELLNEDKKLFIYLSVLEFNKLVNKQKIRGIEAIKEPNISLTKEDMNFIKEMMK